MEVTDALITHVETLSRLALTVEEKQALKGELQQIVGFVETLTALEAPPEGTMSGDEAVPPLTVDGRGVGLRQDVVAQPVTTAALLSNGPAVEEDQFVVPNIL